MTPEPIEKEVSDGQADAIYESICVTESGIVMDLSAPQSEKAPLSMVLTVELSVISVRLSQFVKACQPIVSALTVILLRLAQFAKA